MNGAALDLKEHSDEQKDTFDRYGRHEFVYVMLDKRIDYLSEEIKEVKGQVKDLRDEMRSEFREVRGEIKDIRGELRDIRGEIKDVSLQTNQRIDGLYTQMVSMKLWGIGLLITILFVVLAPHIISLLS